MAVYVLLTFDKDEDAKRFVKATMEDKGVFDVGQELENYVVIPASVRGVWKKPTIFCTREKPGCKASKRGFTRGRKYGWWVCTGCGKPGPLWAQGNAWFTALGTNLIPQSQIAPEYRPPGWDSSAAWDFLPEELLNSVDPLHEWTFQNQGQNVYITKKEKQHDTLSEPTETAESSTGHGTEAERPLD